MFFSEIYEWKFRSLINFYNSKKEYDTLILINVRVSKSRALYKG